MIWLTTFFLLIVGAYLLLQALAERKLVKQLIDANELEEDAGLFMLANERLNPRKLEGAVSLAEEDSTFARMVNRVQEKGVGISDRIESRISSTAANSDTLFERSLSKVQTVTEDAEKKFAGKFNASQTTAAELSIADEDSAVGRMVSKVSETLNKSEEKFQSRVQLSTNTEAKSFSEEDGFFANMVGKVSSKLTAIDDRVDKKLATVRSQSSVADDDGVSSDDSFFSRVAAQVGDRVNTADEKIIEASRKLT